MKCITGPVPWVLVAWVPLLLVVWPAQADYFVSNPDCGLPGVAQQFVDFSQTPQLSSTAASIGVCNWGILDYTNTKADDFAGKCLACKAIPYSDRKLCPAGWRVNTNQTWLLAPVADCTWSTGCLGLPCPANTLEAAQASCGGTGIARSCCPLKPHVLCCQALQCSKTTSTDSGCVVDDKSLSPGQVANTLVYAVQAASSLCSMYSFTTQRTCLANKTLSTGSYYDSCTTSTPSSDGLGCPVLPGYTLVSKTYMNSSEATLDDSTPWALLPSSSKSAAASDSVVMASRCDQSSDCAAFDLTGTTSLRAYVPGDSRWQSSSTYSRCAGTYVKQQLPSSCPRVRGYLFTPGVSWVDASGELSNAVCTTCGVSQDLASTCNADSTCAAFSNMHGLLSGLSPAAASARLSRLKQFTSSTCKGLFVRVDAQAPDEVEALDRLLCGESSYCQPSLEYTWSRAGQWVDINVTLTAALTVPAWLLYPNEATLSALPRIQNLRRLQLVCQNGFYLRGGLPRQLLYLLPSLQQLLLPGCGVSGSLAADLPHLAPSSLHVLDLSDNQLVGPLPSAWGGAWEMSMLNLSNNQLSGPVPSSWVSLPRTASSLNWGDAGEPQEAAAVLNVVDLSHNTLAGPVPRSIITDTCLFGSMRLEFDTAASASAGAMTQRGGGQAPLLALYANPQLRSWTGDYLLAASQRIYNHQESKDNLCGSYGYIIAICVMWGTFLLMLTGILAWWLWRRRRQRLAAQQLQPVSNPLLGTSTTTINPVADPPIQGSTAAASWFERHWSQQWVRQLVFVVRLAVLLADMALDIVVVVWLWQDGELQEAAVCVAFICLAQLVVACGVFWSLFMPTFPSPCALLLGGPPLLLVTPVLAPVMAAWHMFNSNIPLVTWRYLELQEFAVMIFQAPTQSITKTVIYAQQSKLGGGMYINHVLFIVSISLSLVDMAISVFKLSRYKHGPWARVRNAFSHLDQSRDVGGYRALDNGWYENDRPASRYSGSPEALQEANERYRLAFITAKQQHLDAGGSIRNPLLSGLTDGDSTDPFGSPIEGRSRSNTGGGARGAQAGGSGFDGEIQPAGPSGLSGPLTRLSRGSTTSLASANSHSSAWSPCLPPPPTHTSLLQQSSLRLAVNSAMDALTAALPVAQPVQRNPSGRRASAGSCQIVAAPPSGVELFRANSAGKKHSPPRPQSGAPTSPSPGSLRVSASGPSIGRSPLGKRHSNGSLGDGQGEGAQHSAPLTPLTAGGLIPAHLPASRCSTPDYGLGSPVMGSPRVSGGMGPNASEVVLGLFRRVNSQEASHTGYHSAASTGYHTATSTGLHSTASAQATPSYSPLVSRRNSHAGPAGQLHLNLESDTMPPAQGSTAEPQQGWQPAVNHLHTHRPASSPSSRPASPSARGIGGRAASPVPGGSPTATSGSATGVSLGGLFRAAPPSLAPTMRPPLPPGRLGTTPRSRPTSAAAMQPASPRSAGITSLPAGATQIHQSQLQPRPPPLPEQQPSDGDASGNAGAGSSSQGAGRFQPMPTPTPRH